MLKVLILLGLAAIFFMIVSDIWVRLLRSPSPKKPELRVEGWGKDYDDYYPGRLHSD